MGAGNVLPAVPTFSGVPSITDLNSLSYAVNFLVNHDLRPQWTAFMSAGTKVVVINSWTTVAFDHIAFDSDGVFAGGVAGLPTAKIVTQGLYAVEACIPVQASANQDQYIGRFLLTGGTGNPNLGSGQTYAFGYRGAKLSNFGSAAADNAVCLAAWTPFTLYPGDSVQVQVHAGPNSHTIDINNNASYIQGRLVPKFSGRWAAMLNPPGNSPMLDEASVNMTDETSGVLS